MEGRAQPTALYRHRGLSRDPLCVIAWQLGAEPYSVGSIAIGRRDSGFRLFVPGYPIDRDLLFAALLDFANAFCPAFEGYMRGPREAVSHRGEELEIPTELPQIVVANSGTIQLLGRLGRRLAYLSTTGANPADPQLPRMGRHLMWIAEHAQVPGQQLVLPATELLAGHYAAALSALESQSLPAMDAWIDPPDGIHGFHAAEQAERQAVGPVPDPEDGQRVHALMKTFNERRAGRKDPGIVRNLSRDLRMLYDDMTAATWQLVWKVIDRERTRTEAASVGRRARADRIAYARHIQWMLGPAEGRRKTRPSPRTAALRLAELEQANRLLTAEEAIDDPLRMAPHLLTGKALAGDVIGRDDARRELINGRNYRRPSVTVRTQEPCLMPLRTELWWTGTADGREWLIERVVASEGGCVVTLVLQTNRFNAEDLPPTGSRACFSQFNTRPGYELVLPTDAPWTHRSAPPPATTDLDYGDMGGHAA
jgi:hypothetical protein